jgi:CheY-like chemotaxis protein
MDEEEINILFDKFARLEIDNHHIKQGAGLGLPIAYNLAKAMGGNITISSEQGKGSTFTAAIVQDISSSEKLAYVSTPENVEVLVFERREACVESIMRTMENLKLNAHLVLNIHDFKTELDSKNYDFVFVAAGLFIKAKEIYPYLEMYRNIVLVAEFGEHIKTSEYQVLKTPIYSVPIANIINGANEHRRRVSDYVPAPQANADFTAFDARVLFVDDITSNLSAAEELMIPYKIKVELCKNGAEAIKAVKANYFDILFIDQKMPGMDGSETAKYIRSMADTYPALKNIPIITLTTDATAVRPQSLFDDCLSKPLDASGLRSALERFLPKEKIRYTKED